MFAGRTVHEEENAVSVAPHVLDVSAAGHLVKRGWLQVSHDHVHVPASAGAVLERVDPAPGSEPHRPAIELHAGRLPALEQTGVLHGARCLVRHLQDVQEPVERGSACRRYLQPVPACKVLAPPGRVVGSLNLPLAAVAAHLMRADEYAIVAFNTEPFVLKGVRDKTPIERVIEEIKGDMARPHPMNRLLQGDVGSGKTVVAFIAALLAIANGYQAALMVPTEILADQHFRRAMELLGEVGVKVDLLTSKVKGKEREEVYRRIEGGEAELVIGTHALIQEPLTFRRLGLAIVDEQHRFGVIQRAKLKRKGRSPDLLVMTATPIPRTLAMTLYGDMEVSVLDEMPPGRQPVSTRLFREGEREEAYRVLAEEVGKGHQAYVVYPLVEESEQLDLASSTEGARSLQELFPHWSVGLLHGRMRGEEKEEVMRDFGEGRIQVLVATTVIEVGVDVPNATVMLIEHAERFGLSQLHQMRGRIGRGPHPSYCLLLAYGPLSEEAWRRLRVMEETSDGFRIAEEDLALRGPGDILGVRQWGLPDFRVANLARDADLLLQARREAFRLIQEDPNLERHPGLKEVLVERWQKRLELAEVG